MFWWAYPLWLYQVMSAIYNSPMNEWVVTWFNFSSDRLLPESKCRLTCTRHWIFKKHIIHSIVKCVLHEILTWNYNINKNKLSTRFYRSMCVSSIDDFNLFFICLWLRWYTVIILYWKTTIFENVYVQLEKRILNVTWQIVWIYMYMYYMKIENITLVTIIHI